jgi:hypothetical protein
MVNAFGKTYPKIVPVGGFQVWRLNLPLLSVQRFPGQVLLYHARTEPPVASAPATVVEMFVRIAVAKITVMPHSTRVSVFIVLPFDGVSVVVVPTSSADAIGRMVVSSLCLVMHVLLGPTQEIVKQKSAFVTQEL